jgi:4-hydroxy-tetrahydrodipicolinate synthase
MSPVSPVRGVFTPALTPFAADLSVDQDRFLEHCKWLLANGASGLAVFGTTSEANSLTVQERMQALAALVDAGVSPAVLMPGTGCSSLFDSVTLSKHAAQHGCLGVLLLPPFYYKSVSDDGIFATTSEIIQRVGDARLRIYLYHIPQMAGAGYSLPVIGRLTREYPKAVVGIKDSSGDWKNTEAILRNFPGFETFSGSETFLLDTLRLGGAGCISATANVNAAGIAHLVDTWKDSQADDIQKRITTLRKAFEKYPMIPALKATISRQRHDDSWNTVRPPLRPLPPQAGKDLAARLDELGFVLDAVSETVR